MEKSARELIREWKAFIYTAVVPAIVFLLLKIAFIEVNVCFPALFTFAFLGNLFINIGKKKKHKYYVALGDTFIFLSVFVILLGARWTSFMKIRLLLDITPLITLFSVGFVHKLLDTLRVDISDVAKILKTRECKFILSISIITLSMAPVTTVTPVLQSPPKVKPVGTEFIMDPIAINDSYLKNMIDYIADTAPGSWLKVRELRWDLIEPENGTFNSSALAWYRYWISYAISRGLHVMVITMSTHGVSIYTRIGIPKWVPDILSPEGIRESVNFTKFIIANFSDLIQCWQLGNEMDLSFYTTGSSGNAIDKLVYWFGNVSRAAKKTNSSVQLFVNLVYGLPYLEELVSKLAETDVDYIGVDPYPGSAMLGYADEHYVGVMRLYRILHARGKKVWAPEVGYPGGELLHTYWHQEQFLRDAFAVLQRTPAEYVFYCRIYEQPPILYDQDTWNQPTARWDHALALITWDNNTKPAYNVYIDAARGKIFNISPWLILAMFLRSSALFSPVNSFSSFAMHEPWVMLCLNIARVLFVILLASLGRYFFLAFAVPGLVYLGIYSALGSLPVLDQLIVGVASLLGAIGHAFFIVYLAKLYMDHIHGVHFHETAPKLIT